MGIGEGLVGKFRVGTIHTKDEIISAIKEQRVLGIINPGNNLANLLFHIGESRIGFGLDKPPFDPSNDMSEDEYSRLHYSLHFHEQENGSYRIYSSGIIMSPISIDF